MKKVKSPEELYSEVVVVCTAEDMEIEGWINPSRFYYVDAFGNRVFVRKQSRADAQKIIDNYFGYNKYHIRLYGNPSLSNKPVTAKGSNSRKGFSYKHKK